MLSSSPVKSTVHAHGKKIGRGGRAMWWRKEGGGKGAEETESSSLTKARLRCLILSVTPPSPSCPMPWLSRVYSVSAAPGRGAALRQRRIHFRFTQPRMQWRITLIFKQVLWNWRQPGLLGFQELWKNPWPTTDQFLRRQMFGWSAHNYRAWEHLGNVWEPYRWLRS